MTEALIEKDFGEILIDDTRFIQVGYSTSSKLVWLDVYDGGDNCEVPLTIAQAKDLIGMLEDNIGELEK